MCSNLHQYIFQYLEIGIKGGSITFSLYLDN